MKVYYEEFEDGLTPVWLLLPINSIEWQLERFYVPLSAPFEQFKTEDFDSNQLFVTVQIEDLFRNWKVRESIGISLPSIKKRFEPQKLNNNIDEEYLFSNIEQMVVRMVDIEEVLQLEIRNYYKWEVTSKARACLQTR